MAHSQVKAKLAAGQPVIAATLTVPSAEVAAHIARLGFDVLWVEMEHSPITLESLRNVVLATRGLPASVLARVPVNELWTAKRALDQGVCGVIFPFTSTPEQALQAARSCRYPPHGLRGSGAGLAKSTWFDPDNYYVSADENVLVVTVVENREGLDNIEAIAATPGVDIVFIGTSDLAFSLGVRGDQDAPVVRDAVRRIVDAARAAGKPVGLPAVTREQMKRRMDEGFLFLQGPTDLGLLTLGAESYL